MWWDVIDPENRSMATFHVPWRTIITDINDGLVVGAGIVHGLLSVWGLGLIARESDRLAAPPSRSSAA